LPEEQIRLRQLRDRLYLGLTSALSGVSLNGPSLKLGDCPNFCPNENGTVPFCPNFRPNENGTVPFCSRLPGNLNLSFEHVDGETLLVSMKDDLALSSGSACTSASPEPSHVLRALDLDEEAVRSSVRFGLGRFNTAEEVDYAIAQVVETINRLRSMIKLT
jgi:hypothetical protein